MLSIIVPASNEADYIGPCLDALLASAAGMSGPCEVVVVSNASRDATADVARSRMAAAGAAGVALHVLDVAEGGKLNALNLGDAHAVGAARAYVDADVVVDPDLLGQIERALAVPQPAYASGRVVVAPARSAITRAYGRFWSRLPFMAEGVPGCGVFAVNAAGRARWGAFPRIIADDTFARLHFAPAERIGVPAAYLWPMVEGFRRLVRVRRRQDAGMAEIRAAYPHLMANEGKRPLTAARLAQLALANPLDFCVYAAVSLAVRLPGETGWVRGR